MIICHAQHSLVGRSTIGVNLLNATLKIVKHMQKIKKLTMIFYYGSNATYIKIYRYGYLIIRDAFYETALWALPVWVLLSFYSCQHPGILVWLSTSYKQNRLHASAKFVQGNATRVKLLTIRARGNVLARSWVDSCSRTYEQKNMQPTSASTRMLINEISSVICLRICRLIKKRCLLFADVLGNMKLSVYFTVSVMRGLPSVFGCNTLLCNSIFFAVCQRCT